MSERLLSAEGFGERLHGGWTFTLGHVFCGIETWGAWGLGGKERVFNSEGIARAKIWRREDKLCGCE